MHVLHFCKISIKHLNGIGYFGFFLIIDPGIFQYALAYACLKLVNYSFFFWLPYYLHNKYGWKETVADDISIWYDVGGIIGNASYSCLMAMSAYMLRSSLFTF